MSIELWPWGVLIVAVGVYILLVAVVLAAGRREDARALAGLIPDCLVMVGRLARNPRVSRVRRLALLTVLAYLAFPLDLIPDFLPLAGQLDDAVLLALSLRLLLGGADTEMLRAAWPGPEASLRVILRAAGREGNGAAPPGAATTLSP